MERIEEIILKKERELEVLIANGFFFKAFDTMHRIGKLLSILKQHERSAKYHYMAERLKRAINLDIMQFLEEFKKG